MSYRTSRDGGQVHKLFPSRPITHWRVDSSDDCSNWSYPSKRLLFLSDLLWGLGLALNAVEAKVAQSSHQRGTKGLVRIVRIVILTLTLAQAVYDIWNESAPEKGNLVYNK